MKTYYQEILEEFRDDEGIRKAVLSNNAVIYKYLARIIMHNSGPYKTIFLKEGKATADRLLFEHMKIFRNQVNHKVFHIALKKNIIYNSESKSNIELVDHLLDLYRLLVDISPLNPYHPDAEKFEKELAEKQGLNKIDYCRPLVHGALYKKGCVNPDDQDDLFMEAETILWQRIKDKKAGIYFTGQPDNMANCFIYNKDFYNDCSKVCTFLAGTACNKFMNMTRKPENKVKKTGLANVPEHASDDTTQEDHNRQVLMLYSYYRNFVEKRKIRSVISMLRFDCNLKEMEIKDLLGINNARFHFSRLNEKFVDWQKNPANKKAAIIDASNQYFSQKEEHSLRLNEKLVIIDRFERNHSDHVDLLNFREEFHSHPEFLKNHRLFKVSFYMLCNGKPSSFTGLPDEQDLRELLGSYKNIIRLLPNFQALLIYLFYPAEEPGDSIIRLLHSLKNELPGLEPGSETLEELADQLDKHMPADNDGLTGELYASNAGLFEHLCRDKSFINFVN